ncbi:penicillin-binding protein [Rapidithrix thailandica]|uniref:Penicillin-binding protein n=1 Tax=Rapidithrix thailandica TaxID=413964 RepID=A0AAW9SDE0_9BACT
MGIRRSILTRVRIAFACVVIYAIIIFVKVFDIQFVNGEKWRRIARENGLQYREVEATRGNILSDNGSLLATSLPFYEVAFDPTVAQDEVFDKGIDSLSVLLAGFFKEKTADEYSRELREARNNNRKYKVLSVEPVSYQEKKILSQWPIFKEGRSKGGVIFDSRERRFMPFDALARRTIGFTWKDTAGTTKGRGLEFSFNKDLAGVNGQALYQRLSGGRWSPLIDQDHTSSENGYDIQTTLDVELQEFCTNTLKNSLYRHWANYGSVIVMEVETGEIKAMVNLGKNAQAEYVENYNYAVGSQGVAEPGSTFKLASMMALLEETKISVNDTVDTGEGTYEFYEDCQMRDAALYGYGRISVQSVFEKSSNIGISKLVFQHFNDKPEKFLRYLESFGLTESLNFQMKGEGLPFISKPGGETWSGCSLPWMSIGYELKMSPLQILTFFNAVANQGILLKPRLVKKVIDGNKTVRSYDREVLNKKVCSDRTLSILQKMLIGVVERGTAKGIKSEEYKIAGKTGTTQKLRNGQYTQSYYTSFAGYFPADKPKYSCIVVIDNPTNAGKYGGEVAAPIFRQISDMLYVKRVYKEMEHQPVLATEEPALPVIRSGNFYDLKVLADKLGLKHMPMNTNAWVHTQLKNDTIQWVDNRLEEGSVPDVRGMTLRDAMYLLENRGLKVKVFGNGRVVRQSLNPGTRIKKGYQIYISLES